MLSLDQLTDIIARGVQIDVEFKSARRNMSFYGLTDNEITVVNGQKMREDSCLTV